MRGHGRGEKEKKNKGDVKGLLYLNAQFFFSFIIFNITTPLNQSLGRHVLRRDTLGNWYTGVPENSW